MKRFIGLQGNNRSHWVGDGFPVRTLFFYQHLGKQMSPFLMLDYAGPHPFEPTFEKKGWAHDTAVLKRSRSYMREKFPQRSNR
jgi:redox-sensitive bicupin YhaK (pirin superfamily)